LNKEADRAFPYITPHFITFVYRDSEAGLFWEAPTGLGEDV